MITAEEFIKIIRDEDNEYAAGLLTVPFSAADFLNALHMLFDANEELGSDVSKEDFQEWLKVNEDYYDRGLKFLGAMLLAAVRDPACQEWMRVTCGVDIIDYLTKLAKKLEEDV